MALFPFEPPRLRDITRRVIDDVRTRLSTDASLLAHTAEAALAAVVAGVAHPLWRALDRAARASLWATTIDQTYIETWGSIFGVYRDKARTATGIFAITGSVGSIMPAGTVLIRTADGVEYTTDAEVVMPLTEYYEVGITCSTPGEIGNCLINTALFIKTTLPGINSGGLVTGDDITNGADKESIAKFAARFFQRLRYPPGGGKAGDYVRWAHDADLGITRTWEYGGEPQLGYVTVRAVKDYAGTDTEKLTGSEQTALRTYILARMPMGLDCVVPDDIVLVQLNPTIKLDPNTPTVQAAAAKALRLALSRGRIGPTTFSLSLLNQALLDEPLVTGHEFVSPVGNTAVGDLNVLVLGTVTWQDL